MLICREGKYTKYSNVSKSLILAFVANTKEDNTHKILNMIREQNPKFNCCQCCENKEEYANFQNIFFIQYNIYGEPKRGIYLQFDFENEIVIAGNKRYKVKKDDEYTFLIQKTQIKAAEGIQGFYKHIIESMHVNSPFNTNRYHMINKQLYGNEVIKILGGIK